MTRHEDSELSVALVARLSCPARARGRPFSFASPAFAGFAVSRVDNENITSGGERLWATPTSFYNVRSIWTQILSASAAALRTPVWKLLQTDDRPHEAIRWREPGGEPQVPRIEGPVTPVKMQLEQRPQHRCHAPRPPGKASLRRLRRPCLPGGGVACE